MDKKNNRIAAIDIGTNSFHLIIAELSKNKKIKLLDRERIFLRIGNDKQNGLSYISSQDTVKATNVLLNFKHLAEVHKAKISAVATSAVREASNNKDFVKTIFKQTGIKIDIIDGRTEAKLIFLGMKNALPLENSSVLGIDIGGGSTEFIYGLNNKLKYAESVKVGAVRLSNLFFPKYRITRTSVTNCENYVEDLIRKQIDLKVFSNLDFAVGSSGTVDTICLVKSNQTDGIVRKKLNGYEFTKDDFENIYDLIMNLKTPEDRSLVPGLESKRADIIPAGLIILKKIFQLFQLNKMVLSEYALREGVVFKSMSLR
jgi:exopolyphosphatase/guanosine-5'-triphosphate,3'-diphosphate pyrophosphatase